MAKGMINMSTVRINDDIKKEVTPILYKSNIADIINVVLIYVNMVIYMITAK